MAVAVAVAEKELNERNFNFSVFLFMLSLLWLQVSSSPIVYACIVIHIVAILKVLKYIYTAYNSPQPFTNLNDKIPILAST